jgi:hypothetical protein
MALPTNVATPKPNFTVPSNVGAPAYEAEIQYGMGVIVPSGSVTEPAVQFAADADGAGTGIYRSATNELSIATNGVVAATVDANGIANFASGVKLLNGGTVTQATSKSTGVTLSKQCGAITMDAANIAAGTIVSFVLTNTLIAATDVLILNHISGGTVGSYTLNAQCAAGSATINVRNNTAGGLAEAIVIQFALIKGTTS